MRGPLCSLFFTLEVYKLKGTELYTRLQNFSDIDPTTEQVISWLDTWQKDIAAELPPVNRIVLSNVVAETEIALPTDFLSLQGIKENGKDYRYINEINISPDMYISFPYDAVSLTLIYNQIPGTITSLENDLVVHPLLQPIAFYFLVSMYYDKEGEGDEESGMAARWLQQYEYKKREIMSKILNVMGDTPVETRDVRPRSSRRKRMEDDYFE